MQPIDLLFYGMIAVLGAAYIWQFTTKSGRAYREKVKRQVAEVNQAKDEGNYKTPNSQKVAFAILGICVYLGFGWLIGTVLGGGLLLLMMLPGSALLGIIFVIFSVKIADSAERKNRSWDAFFWLSVLVSPIIMGIITASMSTTTFKPETANAKTSMGNSESENLQELVKMKEAGFISEEEFQRKKSQILDRL